MPLVVGMYHVLDVRLLAGELGAVEHLDVEEEEEVVPRVVLDLDVLVEPGPLRCTPVTFLYLSTYLYV